MANLNIANKKVKNSTVFTPKELSYHLYKTITDKYNFKTIFDPCIGANGGMTKYYYENGYEVIGADIDEDGANHCHTFFHQNIKESDIPNDVKPDLIVMNPPFNGNGKGKNLLYPHLFLQTMFDRFGEDIPLVMITGDNFLNNNRMQSARLKYLSDSDFEMSCSMTLPLDIFPGVQFNTQVLFFNMPKLTNNIIFDISKVDMPEEKTDFNSLVSDAAIELNMSKSEVKTLAQKGKINSKLKKDGHRYVNVGEIQTYLTKLEVETIEKEPTILDNVIDDIAKNVLGYSGNKDDLISQIARFMPSKINTIHDRFGGSFSLGLNIKSKKKVYNEIDTNVFNVIKGLSQGTPEGNLEKLLAVEKEYDLGKMEFTLHGKTKEERVAERKIINVPHIAKVKKLMKAYNENPDKPWEQFLMLVSHSFGSRIEYDKKENYKAPVCAPEHYFNPSLQEKILKFSEKLIALGDTVDFDNTDFADYDIDGLEDDDVVYFDPPYKNSDANYVRRLWGEENEIKLYAHLDELHSKGKKFALSNTFVHDDVPNERLIEWAKDYKVYYLKKKYMQSEKSRSGEYETVEVLVTNYGEGCNSPDVVAMYKEDTKNIVQGSFFIDNEVQYGNESHRLAELAYEKFQYSQKQAMIYKCEEMVQCINVGKSIIVFKEKYEIQKKLDRKNEVKTQTYKEAIESAYNFDYETGRRYMKLAADPKIAKLKVEDIMKFKRKSLDALNDMSVLSDKEFSLFLDGKHILKSTRPIAKSRQKPQKPSSTQNDEVIVEDVSNAPDSVEMVPMAEEEQSSIIEKLMATIDEQKAIIEKQNKIIGQFRQSMISNSMARRAAQNNIFPRLESLEEDVC